MPQAIKSYTRKSNNKNTQSKRTQLSLAKYHYHSNIAYILLMECGNEGLNNHIDLRFLSIFLIDLIKHSLLSHYITRYKGLKKQ